MLGVGEKVDIIRESVTNIQQALKEDGILRMNFPSLKRVWYPTPYGDVRLEADYKKKNALSCDLTFWAVEFLNLV